MYSLLYWFFITISLYYFQTTGIIISNLTLFRDSSSLCADMELKNTLDSKTLSALNSGLPLELYISMKIFDDQNVVLKNQVALIVQYDVWDELYTIKYPDRQEQFKSVDSLKKTLGYFKAVTLCPLEQLKPEQEYTLSMKLQIVNGSTGSVIDSIDRSPSSSILGLSSIIKFFFGNSSDDVEWYRSKTFTLNKLEKR